MTLLFLALALCAYPLCYPYQSKPLPPSSVSSPAQQTDKSLDAQVLETVLEDMLTYQGKSVFNEHKGILLFSADAVTFPITLKEILDPRNTNPQDWNNLTLTDIDALREAGKRLINRVKIKDGFQPFTPVNKKIQLFQKKELSKGMSKNQQQNILSYNWDHRPTFAYPPGYSVNRQYALVRLIVPWSIHSADFTYFLAKRDGRWVVLMHQFAYSF